MKNLRTVEKFLFSVCAYAIGITIVFFLIKSAIANPEQEYQKMLSFTHFFYCILLALGIAVANLIFKIKKLKIWASLPIHYLVLLVFFIVFMYVANGEYMNEGSNKIFVLAVIFTFFYAAAVALVVLIKFLISRVDDEVEKKAKKSNKSNKKTSENDKKYSPRFK